MPKPSKYPYNKNNDLKVGKQAEFDFMKLMNDKYNLSLKQAGEYCFYDFFNNDLKIVIELKRRRINRFKYPTTIITYDKVARFEEFNNKKGNQYRLIMVFHFEDGIFYYIHSKSIRYNVKKFKRSPRPDLVDKLKDYIYINTSDLKPINEIMNDINCKLLIRYNL